MVYSGSGQVLRSSTLPNPGRRLEIYPLEEKKQSL